MASKSTPDLLKAIEGFTGEHTGSKQHEGSIALLARVKGEIARGHGGDTVESPGRREARNAAETRMPAEAGHEGGDGQKRSNDPGTARRGEPVADVQAASRGTRTMTGSGPVPSRGNTATVGATTAPAGIVDIRRMAAAKGVEGGKSSEGNKESLAPAPAAPEAGKVGDVKAPAKAPPDKNTGSFEGKPPFAGEQLRGDGWSKAREKARKLAPAPR